MSDKILIIDDDLDTLKLVGLMLERQGYEITVAGNGTQGLSKAATDRPDLILLDVMMPDLDGYEVAKRLRADPTLSQIPIIMFTAKSMVDDKVAGFEAGVDDYLTKPTHPAELTAHVKAVLARSAQAKAGTDGKERATVIGFLGTRGGIGTTTLAINAGVALQQKGLDIVVAEMNPGRGTLGFDLNLADSSGLAGLLRRPLKDIHLRSVETALANHPTGVRLLLSSPHASEIEYEQALPQMEAIVNNLAAMSNAVLLDLGAGLRPYVNGLVDLCDRVVLVVEPVYPSNVIGHAMLEDLEAAGFSRHRFMLALITRMRTSLQLPWRQVQSDLGIELAGIISPAPEQAHQASHGGIPLVVMHRESLVTDQIQKLAGNLAKAVQPVKS